MDNQTAIGLLSLCGIVTVMILLGSFLLIRILKLSIFGVANMVLRSVTDPTEIKTPPSAHAQSAERLHGRDLRAEAKSVDFDAAVASRKGEVVPSVRTSPTNPAPDVNASAFPAPVVSNPPDLNAQRRKIRRQHIEDEDDGEMFEGLLGE